MTFFEDRPVTPDQPTNPERACKESIKKRKSVISIKLTPEREKHLQNLSRTLVAKLQAIEDDEMNRGLQFNLEL